jgi:hypothetical protein
VSGSAKRRGHPAGGAPCRRLSRSCLLRSRLKRWRRCAIRRMRPCWRRRKRPAPRPTFRVSCVRSQALRSFATLTPQKCGSWPKPGSTRMPAVRRRHVPCSASHPTDFRSRLRRGVLSWHRPPVCTDHRTGSMRPGCSFLRPAGSSGTLSCGGSWPRGLARAPERRAGRHIRARIPGAHRGRALRRHLNVHLQPNLRQATLRRRSRSERRAA